jgi:hypothetical protein
MSENKTLVKPEGVTNEEWEAADAEQRELLVQSAAEQSAAADAQKPDVKVQLSSAQQSPDAKAPTPSSDPSKDPKPTTAIAPDLDALEAGASPTEVQNAAARGKVFVGEDGKDKHGNEVPKDKVAVAGP